MERNYTLVKEVRFADQTCVALAERKKYYKNQLNEYKKNLHATNEENALLKTNCESSLREIAQLKVLVESLQSQKQKAESQVDAYRMQIADSEKTHRSSLKTMEKTYQSHLNNAELQINSLTERLQDSLATNTSLQSKLDDVHDKWESKLQSDVASRELIASLKERITSSESTSTNVHASMKTMQTRITDLQTLCDQQKNQLQMERSEREMTEQDRDDLQAQCNDLHRQLTEWAQTSGALEDIFFDKDGSHNEDFVQALREYTPVKQTRSSSIDDGSSDFGSLRTPSGRTPTANLLARTLRSELKRRQTMSQKLEHAEDQVTSLKLDIEEAKADNILLKEELDEKDAHITELNQILEAKDDQIARLTEEIEVRSWDGGEGGELEEKDAHITELNLMIGEKDDHIARLTEEIEIRNWEGRDSSTDENVSQSESQYKSQFQREHDSMSVLEERLDALEGTLEVTDDELKETKARLADTQEMLDQTAGELERSEEDLAAAHHQLSDYEAQVDKLFKDLTEKEVEQANLERFSQFQKSTIETIKDKLSQSEKINAELHTQMESCFQSLMALEKILRTYEDLDGVAGQIITEQCRKVSRLLETMAQMSPRNTSNTPREFGPRAELDFESPSIFSDYRQENQIKMELDVVNKKYSELNVLLSNVTLENGRLKAKLDESNKQIQNANKLLKRYQDNFIEQENGQIREIETRFNMELNVANKQLQQANKLLEEYQNELCNQEDEHSEEIIFLKKQRDELEAKLLEIKTADNTLSQQLSVMRSNNTDLMKENESLRLTLQSFELQLEDEKSLLRATREAADGYRLDVTNAKAAFEIITTEKDMIKNTLTKVEKQTQDLQLVINEKDKFLKDSRESLLKAQVTLKEQTESMKAQCKDLETRLSVEESGRLSAEASLDDAYVHIAKLEEIMKMNEKDSEVKDSECHQLIIQVKEIQNALAEAERDRADAELTIERLENELHDKQSIIFAYEESIISYKGDIRGLDNKLQSTIHEKNSRIEMLEQACNSRQALFFEQLDRTQKERDASTAELTDMINRLQNELFESNRLYQESGERTKSTMFDMTNAYQLLEVEMVRKQAQLDELTQKFDYSCEELRQAHNEICRITDKMSSVEIDCERMGSRHQDEMNELLEQRNQMHEERVQLEEQILSLQDKLSMISQHRDEIAELSAQNDSLHKKCERFKNVIKALNENNKAWETSYNAQTDDLMSHARESSRLNEQLTALKRVLNSSEQSGLRTRQLHLKVDAADPSWSLEGPRTDNVRTQPFGNADDDRFMDPKWGMRPASAL
jgi:chromosome segregation ATPase